MSTKLQLHLTRVFLKIFLRDRQSMFFSLFFPLLFMTVMGLMAGGGDNTIKIGIVNNADSSFATRFIETLDQNPLFGVSTGAEKILKKQVLEGDLGMVLVIPQELNQGLTKSSDIDNNQTELTLIVDKSQTRRLAMIMPVLEQALISAEHSLRKTQPLFSLVIEDVKARSQSYLDFVLPGIIAFTLMQIGIAGSGFNIVEYRRKGILKRLFVTPIRPADFIVSIVIARLILCLMQLSVLLAIAVLILNASVIGSFAALYFVVILGTIIFLCIGFCLGSIAKTQQAIGALGNLVIFPQIFLSGVFYPIDTMPDFIQPIASLLPLSFVATSLREIANNGSSLLDILPDLMGIAVWLVIAFILATRMFAWKEVAK